MPATHPAIARTFAGLADVASRQGHTTEALDLIRKATVPSTVNQLDELARSRLLKHVAYAWAVYASPAGGSTGQQLLEESFDNGQRVEQTEAAAAVSRMAARVAAQDAGLQELARTRDELQADLKLLDRRLSSDLALPTDKRPGYDDLRRAIDDSNARLAQVDEQLKTRFPEYFGLVSPNPVSVKEAASLLKPDEALIGIVCGYSETYVWAISNERAEWHRADTDRQWLSDSVTSLRKNLDVAELQRTITPNSQLFNLALAHELYARLLQPVESVFAQKKQLIIVPCGPLTSLPFHLLVRDKPAVPHPNVAQLAAFREADWLMRHYAISLLPAVTNLKALRSLGKIRADRKALIGFGNPKFASLATGTATRGLSSDAQS